jgi:[acyl-carrier-protein] S-malonyltransferase
MTRTAILFAGQGGQFVGMGADWAAQSPEIADIFKLADEASGRPIAKLCFEGPIEEITQTSNLQPAVLAVGLAAWRLAKKTAAEPIAAAGHSLGEFGALAAAGALGEFEALALVSKRALLMEKAAKNNPGAMTAILGLSAKDVEAVCELARDQGQVAPANYNAPLQTVISGQGRAVAAATRFAEMKGGKAIPLPVSGAFHSPLMGEAAEAFKAELEKVALSRPAFPVIPNALGKPTSDPAEIKKYLAAQMTSPVLFTLTVESLSALGADDYLECWPKPYLGPMVRKSLPPDGPKAAIRQAGKAA